MSCVARKKPRAMKLETTGLAPASAARRTKLNARAARAAGARLELFAAQLGVLDVPGMATLKTGGQGWS